MHVDLFFDNYFNFLGAKTKLNKSVLNLINLDGLEALKDKYLVLDWKYRLIIFSLM